MQNVYDSPAELEKLSKAQYGIPDLLMMENAARSMKDFILALPNMRKDSGVLIICGKGNNGGDGFALARHLQDKANVTVCCVETPSSAEALVQYLICQQLNIKVVQDLPVQTNAAVIVDCLYGIGFHGELEPKAKKLLDAVNTIPAVKIACDVPSGFYFKADYTITMGEQKLMLYSDAAKAVCGKIIVADLGLSRSKFEEPNLDELKDSDSVPLLPLPVAFLIDPQDMKLPLRTERAAHKGNYGHTAVFAGGKAGAGIMAATAALNFGCGLTTLIPTEESNISQFQISPELMISEDLPEKTSCVILGPGLSDAKNQISQEAVIKFMNWFSQTHNPACVLDADIFNFIELKSLLEELNEVAGARIVLTPHLKEYEKLIDKVPNVSSLKNVTIIKKSANTFIYSGGETYICSDGAQSLAKGGSGDVLAGMIGALLAQGYSSVDAAVTAVEAHALIGKETGPENFSLTPETLLEVLSKI